mmetsp:Transcript_6299/g.15666  ORF Transcript_6299/g.15666 Transcript_6299/m.15666 type:complete len:261 (-) Transcript_6299:663-1445(-)
MVRQEGPRRVDDAGRVRRVLRGIRRRRQMHTLPARGECDRGEVRCEHDRPSVPAQREAEHLRRVWRRQAAHATLYRPVLVPGASSPGVQDAHVPRYRDPVSRLSRPLRGRDEGSDAEFGAGGSGASRGRGVRYFAHRRRSREAPRAELRHRAGAAWSRSAPRGGGEGGGESRAGVPREHVRRRGEEGAPAERTDGSEKDTNTKSMQRQVPREEPRVPHAVRGRGTESEGRGRCGGVHQGVEESLRRGCGAALHAERVERG